MTNRLTIESVSGGARPIVIDRATQYELVRDLTAPSEARFEMGDDGAWEALEAAIAIGARFRVAVDGRPWVTGRLLTRQLPVSDRSGATIQLTVRTRLADAMFTSCDPKITVKGAKLVDVVAAAYATLGLTAADITFLEDARRDTLSGRDDRGQRPADVRDLTSEEARVHPPETVHAFVERHLNRFGLTQWDARDGGIIIGAPDDSQREVWHLRMSRQGQENNLLSANKAEDFEGVPEKLWVFGMGGGRDVSTARIRASESDSTLTGLDSPLRRTAMVTDQGIKTQAQAEARARREMSARSRAKDAWTLGLDYWVAPGLYEPFDVNQTVTVSVARAGLRSATHLIWRVALRGSAEEGHTAELQTVGQGVWRL